MKYYKIVPIITILSILLLVSCEDEPVDPALLIASPSGPGTNTGVFTADIDGGNFIAGSKAATYVAVGAVGHVLTITGIKPTGEYIAIQMANPSVGTFIADNNTAPETNIILSYRPSLASTDVFTAFNPVTNQPSGILKITSFDLVTKKVSGTFNFVGYPISAISPMVQISNGVFTNIPFIIQ